MEGNVSFAQASMDEVVLPARVQEALGQLVGSAKEGLLALSVGVGLGVLAELLEEEVLEVVGAKGKHDPDRVAVRHGHESGEVTLGGRRVPVERPRVRTADGQAEVRREAPVQRCVRHKERNVLDHLPERDRPLVKQRLRRAWALDDHARALEQLRLLAGELEHAYPGAAGSLCEGMEETLTLTRLGIGGNLKRTLESTNPCESMLEIVRHTQRNVKRWSSGEMALRWTAAGMLEAERQFRRIIGYRDLATLVVAIERDLNSRRHNDTAHTATKEAAIVAAM